MRELLKKKRLFDILLNNVKNIRFLATAISFILRVTIYIKKGKISDLSYNTK